VLLKYLTLLKKDKLDKENNYFEIRSKRAKIIRSRSNFNFFAFPLFKQNYAKYKKFIFEVFGKT
jgi:hypothetical protein